MPPTCAEERRDQPISNKDGHEAAPRMFKIFKKSATAIERHTTASTAVPKPTTLSARDPLAFAAVLKALG